MNHQLLHLDLEPKGLGMTYPQRTACPTCGGSGEKCYNCGERGYVITDLLAEERKANEDDDPGRRPHRPKSKDCGHLSFEFPDVPKKVSGDAR